MVLAFDKKKCRLFFSFGFLQLYMIQQSGWKAIFKLWIVSERIVGHLGHYINLKVILYLILIFDFWFNALIFV